MWTWTLGVLLFYKLQWNRSRYSRHFFYKYYNFSKIYYDPSLKSFQSLMILSPQMGWASLTKLLIDFVYLPCFQMCISSPLPILQSLLDFAFTNVVKQFFFVLLPINLANILPSFFSIFFGTPVQFKHHQISVTRLSYNFD